MQGHFYAGIGSRETPDQVLGLMTKLGTRLEELGLILRSGAADGADSAFEQGVQNPTKKEIFLPWNGFSGRSSMEPGIVIQASKSTELQAMEIAATHHPMWEACKPGARMLHTRNVYQVLGIDLFSPSSFIVCWTVRGLGAGGTGQAIRIAKHYDIPVFDLGLPDQNDVLLKLGSFIETLK